VQYGLLKKFSTHYLYSEVGNWLKGNFSNTHTDTKLFLVSCHYRNLYSNFPHCCKTLIMTYQLPALIFLTSLFGCNEKKIDIKAEGEKLMQVSREWSKSAATDNIEKTMSYWADSAIFLSAGQPILNGKNEIRGMVERSGKIPGFKISWEPISVSISESGDMAYMIEQNQVTVNDSLGIPVTKFGKGVTIWKKDTNGSWKNVVEIGVDDVPKSQ
jgi:ketosteroid isomerase-like protein